MWCPWRTTGNRHASPSFAKSVLFSKSRCWSTSLVYPQVATVGGWLWCLLQPFCWSLFFIFILYYLCASKMPWLSPNTMLVERLVVISIILIVICSIYWEKKYLARSSWEGGELVSFHCLSADRSPCCSHYIWGWRLRLAFILLTTKKYTRFVFL
jgi:hypothetical protein